MLIKEYRLTMPLSVEEYEIGQLFSVSEASKNETGGGEGVEILKNEPFHNHSLLNGKFKKGQYTYKIYHLKSKVPSFIRLLVPKGSLEVHEESWNAYPYCRTVITNPGFMKEDFFIIIESYHIADTGKQENVHELPPEKLKIREVIFIDIANDHIHSSDYRASEDPQLFQSERTGRGPLKENWTDKVYPAMTCYKLVSTEFKWFGLQTRIENYIQKSERRLFTTFHRQIFCWIDRWIGLTMRDIREIENRAQEDMERLRRAGSVRGMTG